MVEENEGASAFTGHTTETASLPLSSLMSEGYGEDDSWLMASKHGHILPIDTDKLEVHEKPSELLERHIQCESGSTHIFGSVVYESIAEARDDVDDGTEATEKMSTVRDPSSSSSRGFEPKIPTDSYLDSLHTRLESSHFRRDEKEEDFIDIFFEEIELLACEMGGKNETIRDILDDTFEYLEDVTCGRTSRRRNAYIRASFEKFLQSVDKLAAIYPKKQSSTDDSLHQKDLLDAICDQIEKINCTGRVSGVVEGIGEFFTPVVDATRVASEAVSDAARNVATTCADARDDPFFFMSISEDTGDLTESHFTQTLPRISEEYSLASSSSQSRSLPRLPSQKKSSKLSHHQFREELIRRNNLKRMRGNIHVHLSKKTVLNKMVQAKETVEDAFDEVGDQLATIFENMEMGIWDMLVLSADSSLESISRDGFSTTHPSHDRLMSTSSDIESVLHRSPSPTIKDPKSPTAPSTSDYRHTEVGEIARIPLATTSEEYDDPPSIHATSSEETYTSGCGARRRGVAAKRFQMVDEIKKAGNKDAETGRWTPHSNVTGSTCDETVSSGEGGSPTDDHSHLELRLVPSDSMRMDRMEMVAYMSMHERGINAVESKGASSHTGRTSNAVMMLDTSCRGRSAIDMEFSNRSDSRGVLASTECNIALSPRLEEPLEEISFTPTTIKYVPSIEGDTSLNDHESLASSHDDHMDISLGKASNRSNRSVLVVSDVVSMDEVGSLPHTATAASTTPQVSTTAIITSDDLPQDNIPHTSIADDHLPDTSTADDNIHYELTADESFATALQSMKLSESEEADFPLANSSFNYKSRLFKNWSDQSLLSAMEEYPDDELHRPRGRPGTPCPFHDKKRFIDGSIVRSDGSSSSFETLLNTILYGTKVGGGWVGKQAVNTMAVILFVSASSVVAANGALQAKLRQRRQEREEQMTNIQTDIPNIVSPGE